jgi:hypothetical protein
VRSIPESELAWVLADYEAKQEEAPERVKAQPEACEGELMSEAEVEQFIYDGLMTLRLLQQKQSQAFEKVRASFEADMKFLVVIGRLDADDYNELIKPRNYQL